MYYKDTRIRIPPTLPEIIAGHQRSVERIRLIFETDKAIAADLDKVGISSKYSFDTVYKYQRDYRTAEERIEALTSRTWRHILETADVYRYLSAKRRDELDTRMEKGDMPPVTTEAVGQMFLTWQQNAQEMMDEVVKEAYDILRPTNGKYKSNNPEEIVPGRRVIIHGYDDWRNESRRVKVFRIIDRAMHLLDGKEMTDGYRCPLADSVHSTPSDEGKTEYWRWRTFNNGNTHLWPLRDDLVMRINQIVGATRSKSGSR